MCQSATQNVNTGTIPNVPVNIQVNLQSITYSKLLVDNGWVYLNGGNRGIILYRANSSSYLAFERTCSYYPNNTCARVKVDASNFNMIDTCCGSYFNFSGVPTSGPATLQLKQYLVTLNGYLLNVTN
jgi:hypothetical protein